MTVAEAGKQDGYLLKSVGEIALDTDEPSIIYERQYGAINSDLTLGIDVTKAKNLKSNEGLCSPGVKLHGAGFIVSKNIAEAMLVQLENRRWLKPYKNGRDLAAKSRNVFVIDLFGLSAEEARKVCPTLYTVVADKVKPVREKQTRVSA